MKVILSAGKNLLDEIMLNESGTLERISEERAKELLANDFGFDSRVAANDRAFKRRLGVTVEIGNEPVTIERNRRCSSILEK